MWCETVEAEDYAAFLGAIRAAVSTSEGGSLRGLGDVAVGAVLEGLEVRARRLLRFSLAL